MAAINRSLYSSVPCPDPGPRPPGRCRYPRYYPDGRPRPCRSQRCPCGECRRAYARREAAVLRRSFRERPPTYFVTLRIEDDRPADDREMATCLRRFTQKVRDHRKSTGETFEYYLAIEFRHARPHVHMLAITGVGSRTAVKRLVKCWWSDSCRGRPTSVYCGRVRSPEAVANYVAKHLKDRRGVERPPDDWSSRTCRLVWPSRGS